MDIGAIIRAARQKIGLTQAQLGEAIGEGQHWVSHLEGKAGYAEKIGRALAALGLTVVERGTQPGSIDEAVDASLAQGLGVVIAVDHKGKARVEVVRPALEGKCDVAHKADTMRPDVATQIAELLGVAGR